MLKISAIAKLQNVGGKAITINSANLKPHKMQTAQNGICVFFAEKKLQP